MANVTDAYEAATSSAAERQRCDRLAVELIRALRGRRSRAELSRRAGYRSNIVQRWEAGQCWPTAARFLAIHAAVREQDSSWLQRFFKTPPPWAAHVEPTSPAAVAAFLRQLRGNTPVVRVAKALGRNRYTVARWLEGSAEPKLPEFLHFVSVVSQRLVDLAAALDEPKRLPSVRNAWEEQERARQAAYDFPWSHGVLRALELADMPQGLAAQKAWIGRQLQLPAEHVQEALSVLEASGQVSKRKGGYRLNLKSKTVNTNDDPIRSRQLKQAWIGTALERLTSGQPGRYGYSLFAISKTDLAKIQELHLEFVRTLQQVIADSEPSECVGLYCSQLLNLDGSFS